MKTYKLAYKMQTIVPILNLYSEFLGMAYALLRKKKNLHRVFPLSLKNEIVSAKTEK